MILDEKMKGFESQLLNLQTMAHTSTLLTYALILFVPSLLDPTQRIWKTANDSVHFVVINRRGCLICIPSTATALDLSREIAHKCDISFRFEIQLFEETIVSPLSLNNQTITEIPRIVAIVNDLYHIWGNGFRIPISVHPFNISSKDSTVYASLMQMFGGPSSNVHQLKWYQFIKQCAKNNKCAVHDLCGRFREHFICDQDGHLFMLKIHEKITGNLDLTFLPETVVSLMMDRNAFSQILGLDQLSGKKVWWMDIRRSLLDLDLEPLSRTSPRSIGNPLKDIRVSANQISWALLGIRGGNTAGDLNHVREKLSVIVHHAVTEWFNTSILDYMTIGHQRLTRSR